MTLSLSRTAIAARRIVMNFLMGTSWYPGLRYRLRRRATTGTGDMDGTAFAQHVKYNFGAYRKHLRGRIDDFAGLRVLEIGPGEHLGVALLLVSAGARQVVSIDHTRELRNSSPAVVRMYETLVSCLPDGLSSERFRAALATLPDCENSEEGPLSYRANMPLERATAEALGQFDLIVSTSVLEHVKDLRGSFRAMHSLLRPGGWIAHCVDLSSHDRYEQHPLEFLETGSVLWNLQFGNIGGPNRHRIGDYRRFMSDAGFGDLYVHTDARFPLEEVERVRPRLAEGFRGTADEDLRASVIFVCAKKGQPLRA